jgi:hypothetical protein
MRFVDIGEITQNRGAKINVWIVLDVFFLIHRRSYRRRTAVVTSRRNVARA